ncbi:MAG: hypothetical protein QMC19_01785 [Flavobacteriaceae bacterium]
MINSFFTSKFSRNSFLIACVVYLFSAYHSIGFYHADEHYQILEFANMKLGNSPAEELPWEYDKKIRPVVQVSFAMVVIRSLKQISITSPYTQALVLRCITALLILLTSTFFIRKTRYLFTDLKQEKWYILSSYFLWFLPFLSARFSSEIWSGVFFLWMISLYLEKDTSKRNVFLMGFLAAVSFLFRFQIAFALFGFFSWLFFMRVESKRFYLKYITAFIMVLIFGFLLDSWFYETLTFTPFNYLNEFIATNDKSNYGASPWYYYLEKIITFPRLFIGIPLFISLLFFFIKNPKNMFTWILVSFLFFHSIVGHKEERFMFPMVFMFPLILSFGYSKYLHNRKPKVIFRVVLVLFFAVNFFLIFLMSTKGAGRGRLVIAEYVYEHYQDKEIDLIYTTKGYLFEDPSGPLFMNFYKQQKLHTIEVSNLCEISTILNENKNEKLVVIELGDLLQNDCLIMENAIFLKESLPIRKEWILAMNNFGFKTSKLDKILLLYKFNERK